MQSDARASCRSMAPTTKAHALCLLHGSFRRRRGRSPTSGSDDLTSIWSEFPARRPLPETPLLFFLTHIEEVFEQRYAAFDNPASKDGACSRKRRACLSLQKPMTRSTPGRSRTRSVYYDLACRRKVRE